MASDRRKVGTLRKARYLGFEQPAIAGEELFDSPRERFVLQSATSPRIPRLLHDARAEPCGAAPRSVTAGVGVLKVASVSDARCSRNLLM